MSFRDAPEVGIPEIDAHHGLVNPSLRIGHEWMFTDRVHEGARDLYDLDWLNINDITENIGLLDREPAKAAAVRAVLAGNFDGHYAADGMKERALLPAHLLLLVLGRVVDRLPRYGTRVVTCCLRDAEGRYSPDNVNLRFLNPRCALRDHRRFLRRHNPAALFDEGFEARILLLHAPPEIQHIGDAAANNADTRRREFRTFFNTATDHLNALVKRGRLRAYFASCEVSCQSIWDSMFFPHVHAVVWMPANTDPEWLLAGLPEGVTLARPGGVHREFRGVERFISYLYRVNSLTGAYSRERDDHDLREFNRRTVNAGENLVTLMQSDAEGRGFRRIRYRQLPPVR